MARKGMMVGDNEHAVYKTICFKSARRRRISR